MLVSLGEWGEDGAPAQRAAFYCRVRPTDDSYDVMLGDASHSVWRDAEIVGAKLSREEALRHPWKETAFEVLDEAFLHDPSLRGFLHRVRCGNAAVPLERNFQMPDDVFALGDERKDRAEIQRNFVSLDGKRFFVRCLLPVPIESYGSWCVGLWVEVSKNDYDRAWGAWDDAEAYPALRFSGIVANDLAAELDLPVVRGSEVQLHAPDLNEPLQIVSPADPQLASVLSTVWSKGAFEEYAVARGFL
jgi:hypothetical protein